MYLEWIVLCRMYLLQSNLECRHISHNGVKHFLCKILNFEVAQISMDIMAASTDNMIASVTILGGWSSLKVRLPWPPRSTWHWLLTDCQSSRLSVSASMLNGDWYRVHIGDSNMSQFGELSKSALQIWFQSDSWLTPNRLPTDSH